MNSHDYINSGILEEYCLGTLAAAERTHVEAAASMYEEVRNEIRSIQDTLSIYVAKAAIWPGWELQDPIWGTLENIEKEKALDLNNLPLINKYTDYGNWKKMVRPLMPINVPDERIVEVLRHTPEVTQVLIISRTDVEDEVHVHEHESFIVLEGECECNIEGQLVRLGPGGYIEIPLHTHHHVKALTPYVIAIMQRIAV